MIVGVTLPGTTDEQTEASLDELALLVDTAGADEVARLVQRATRAGSHVVHRQGQGRGAAPDLPRCRRRHRRVRQRAVAGAAVQPRETARPYRDRPHRGDPRHLRTERPHARGQGAGRAGAAALPPAATPAWRHRQTVPAARRCRCSVRQRRDEARGRSPAHHAPHHQARVRHEGSGGNTIAAAQESPRRADSPRSASSATRTPASPRCSTT